MRTLYLIRHGHPDIPLGERWCLGRTDLPLAPIGRMQAALLPFCTELRDKPVYSSYLTRALETAYPLCPEPLIRDGLEEQDLGEWDGLPFSEIMVRWPELYAAREKNPDLWPESAENTESVRRRMHAAVLRCLEETEGDLVIVSHKSAIASLTGQRPKLLHTSISTLSWDGKKLTPLEIGRLPHPALTEEVCMALLHAAGTPEPVIAHCRAVAEKALRLADRAEEVGAAPDRQRLYAAALLHDIARTEPDHAAVGAAWLRTLGYTDVADIVARHHDWEGDVLDDAALLFLADKYLQGDREVTLHERFALSRTRCLTPEALQAHGRRLEAAERIENTLNRS
jgi:putative nucleotidyltransferase with HDIG domain